MKYLLKSLIRKENNFYELLVQKKIVALINYKAIPDPKH